MRELFWMVRARRIDEWDRFAFAMSWISRTITGEKIDPRRLNIYRTIPQKTAEQQEIERKANKAGLSKFLQSLRRG